MSKVEGRWRTVLTSTRSGDVCIELMQVRESQVGLCDQEMPKFLEIKFIGRVFLQNIFKPKSNTPSI